ncbi:hypothetical protein [Streptomyces sp. NPDC007264]|uniref:hypothetical protein n=1 Tax=Streptomyces sp. NPDC007264 TaxID=3364777 RepID=UPI0036D9C09A
MHRRISSKSLRVLAAGVTATAVLAVVGAAGHAARTTAPPTRPSPTASPAGPAREGPAETGRWRRSRPPAVTAAEQEAAGRSRCTHTPGTARTPAADPAP